MSKSKGEFLTVSLLTEKGFNPLVYRYFCLQSHYRKNLVFSWENLKNAKTAYNKLVARIAALTEKEEDAVEPAAFESAKRKFTDALDNDLNTSLAVTALYDVFKLQANDKTKLALIRDFERVLSLGLLEAAENLRSESNEEKSASSEDSELVAYIEERIAARAAAKAARNFAEADAIRAELLERGVTLIDSREGTKYTVE